MQELIDLIPIGKKNRITAKQISECLGLEGSEIRTLIHNLRLEGYPIGSDNDGYWICTDASELNGTINQLASRMHRISEVRDALLKTRTKMESGTINKELFNVSA